jgi:hypothetical protein
MRVNSADADIKFLSDLFRGMLITNKKKDLDFSIRKPGFNHAASCSAGKFLSIL